MRKTIVMEHGRPIGFTATQSPAEEAAAPQASSAELDEEYPLGEDIVPEHEQRTVESCADSLVYMAQTYQRYWGVDAQTALKLALKDVQRRKRHGDA